MPIALLGSDKAAVVAQPKEGALLAMGMEVGDDERLIAEERIFCGGGEGVRWCFESLRVLCWPGTVLLVGGHARLSIQLEGIGYDSTKV